MDLIFTSKPTKDADKTIYINIEILEYFVCTQEDIKSLGMYQKSN
ncbi:MAG: hypothetical protein AB2375_03945 [Tissierellaceae bacterium]